MLTQEFEAGVAHASKWRWCEESFRWQVCHLAGQVGAFSPEGTSVVTGLKDQLVVWNSKTGAQVRT